MTNSILPVFETVEFLRIVSYGEGKRGKFAVALVRRNENQYTTLFAEEEFPSAKVQLIKEGQIIKVQPSHRGLRARLKDQDIKLLAESQESLNIEICHLKDKVDGFENRSIEWRNGFEKRTTTRFENLELVVEQLKALLICAFANEANE